MTSPRANPSIAPAGEASPPPINRWALHAAAAAGLVALLDERRDTLAQLGLFAAAAGLNSAWMGRFFGRHWGLAKGLYLALSIPVFLWLADFRRSADELLFIRGLYYVLLGAVYLLPFLRVSSARDLRRVALVLAACFFIAATYFHSGLFSIALLASAFALIWAFHSLRPTGGGGGLRAAGSQLLASVLGAVVLFLIFPRAWFGNPASVIKYGGRDQVSPALANQQQAAEVGMSTRRDMLQLAHLIDFSRGNVEVLKVRLTVATNGARFSATNSMYLRAAIFENYLNGNWFARQGFKTRRDEDDGRRDGWIGLSRQTETTNGLRLRQLIQMEPMEDICFCLPDPVAIRSAKIRYDPRGILAFANKFLRTMEYEVVSELPASMSLPALDASPPPKAPAMPGAALYVPSDLRPLLNRVVGTWHLTGSPARQARQICANLQTQFEYGPASFLPVDGVDPVRFFLTGSRSGYCTHFATVLALMARSIGLPARVATGFHFAGPPNPDGAYHLYERNAHAWTEIYFPGHGWVIFDPTPTQARPSAERTSGDNPLWSILAKLMRAHDQLSDYDILDQRKVMTQLRGVVRTSAAWWKPRLLSPWTWLGLGGACAIAWIGFGQLPLRQRRRVGQWLAGRPTLSSVPFYADLLWLLDRRGLAKPPVLTGQEFAAAMDDRLAAPEIAGLTRQFYRVKYAGVTLSAEETRAIARQLRQVEATLRLDAALARRYGLSKGGRGVLTMLLLAACPGTAAPGDPETPAKEREALAGEVSRAGWIAYSAKTDRGDWDLFVMRPDGAARHPLTDTPAFNETGVRFSPGGKRILYYRLGKTEPVANNTYGRFDLVLADADGRNPVVYGPGYPWASWGPDGTQIACLTPKGIQMVDVVTRKVARELPRQGIVQQLVWSPDGKWFLGTANGLGPYWNIGRLNAATGEINPVSEVDRYNCTPDWAPNSREVVYARGIIPEKGGRAEMWVAGGDGNGKQPLYTEAARHVYGACVSPDGQYLLFTRSDDDMGEKDSSQAVMAIIRRGDTPMAGGVGASRRFPEAKHGPRLDLGQGWEPHWTANEVSK